MNEDALEKLKRMAMQRYTDRIKSGEKMPQYGVTSILKKKYLL